MLPLSIRRAVLALFVFALVLPGQPGVLEKVQPASGMPPCAPFQITVEGQNIPFDGQVVLGGMQLVTNAGNGGQLIATVTSAALSAPGTAQLVVVDSTGQTSSPLPFLINPTPLQSLSPNTAPVGNPDLTLRVTGNCFEPGATVLWNGASLATTFSDATTLHAVVTAANFSAAGVARVSVRNANGNTSVAVPFRVGPPPGPDPTPSISSLNPPETTAAPGAATIGIVGSNFSPQAVVVVNGTPAARANTLWLSDSRITLTLPPGSITLSGARNIKVRNPDGAVSNTASFLVRPVITSATPSSWTIGRPCDLFLAGRGFSPDAEVLIDGPAGLQRLPPTSTPTATQLGVCVPAPQVSAPGRVQVSVCAPGRTEVCSAPTVIDVVSGLTITQVRPMSAPAGSGPLCLAVDVRVPGGDPGALVARWDGADLPPGVSQCPATTGLTPAATEIAQGVFTTTILAEVNAALLAATRPRDPAVPCATDPLAPKITAFAPSLQSESAPACFDITPLRPTFDPPTLDPASNGCVSVILRGESIHRSAEVTVDGLQDGFCTGGEPMITGCGIRGVGPSICNQVTLVVPSGSGVISLRIRNPDALCPGCTPQTFTVDIDQAQTELPPDALSLVCGDGRTAFPRTPVKAQSRLNCSITNSSDGRGEIGALAMTEPFSVDPGDCVEAFLGPGESCSVDLLFAPTRVGLFASELTLTGQSSASLGRYLGVGILRGATLSILDDALTPAGQSAVRIETDGAEGSDVLALLRQSLRLESSVPVFPVGEGTPDVDCGLPAAVVGVEYAQPLVAACDTAGASWEISPLDGGEWASVSGNRVTGTPTQTGVFDYEVRLSPAFPGDDSAVTRTCSITVVDAPIANGSASGTAPLMPCTAAQFAMGGARQQLPLAGDSPTDVAFQTGSLAGELRFIASFEADGVDVSPPPTSPGSSPSGVEVNAAIALQAPVISAATFSCPSSNQLVVEASGYSSTREVASMRFAFQPAPGATTSLQLGADAASRPDLVSAFQTRYASGANAGELDGGFQLQAIFAVSGQTSDIGGVTLTLQNSVGGATATASGGCR